MFYSRNIGLITEAEQKKICNGSILIAGVGGMGGVAAEVLVRMGLGKIKICDHDTFEESNFNRQLHSNTQTIGRAKVEVLKEELLKINPNLKIESYTEGVTKENIHQLLDDVQIVINGMDKMYYSLILERTAREKGLTIVDAWLTPYASVFVMTPNSPHWEEFMDLPTNGVPLDQITEELCRKAVEKEIEYTFSHFTPYQIIDRSLVNGIANDKRVRPSLAPVVWLSGILMANEAVKVLTGQPHTDHAGIFYNQYEHQTTKGNINIKKILKAS
ncbi:MAG: ThiF family adenylyltransferase [Bacteriovorax sp.]|nr:ThiF family adenylyltransferase [Bacteriovorax sp.]